MTFNCYFDKSSFCFTYGDGVACMVNRTVLAHHSKEDREPTPTAVQPPGRYGSLHLDRGVVSQFQEKFDGNNPWIYGGFFALNPSVVGGIAKNTTNFESDVLPQLAAEWQLRAHRQHGFRQLMDILRDRTVFEEL